MFLQILPISHESALRTHLKRFMPLSLFVDPKRNGKKVKRELGGDGSEGDVNKRTVTKLAIGDKRISCLFSFSFSGHILAKLSFAIIKSMY